MKSKRVGKLFDVLNYTFFIVISFTFAFPFWRSFVLSFNDGNDAMKGGINFWPRQFSLDNYRVIFSKPDIVSAYTVTITRTLIGTALSVFFMALMAYALSKRHLKGRNVINVMILITMFFSGGMIPSYLLFKELGLLNTIWVYIVPAIYQTWNVILLRTFFQQLPPSLEESAKIDGANDAVAFFKIILPLSRPIIATIALFVAVGHWNDWFAGEFYIYDKKLIPLQTMLMRIIQENDSIRLITDGASSLSSEGVRSVTSYSIKMATLVSAVLPILCVYPFLQKYFVKGILVGSIKG